MTKSNYHFPVLRMQSSGWILIATLFTTVVLGCGSEKKPLVWRASRPSVILISLDTVRADHLSCYGYHRPTSPRIDRISEQGVRFLDASTPISHTLPAHVSLFSSTYPRDHMVLENAWKLERKVPLLAERFKDSGYKTGAIIGAAVLDRKMGLAAGFDHYNDEFKPRHGASAKQGRETGVRKTADRVVEEAICWIQDQDTETPLFMFIHFFDAHRKYDAIPSQYKVMFPMDDELQRIAKERRKLRKHYVWIGQYDGSIRFIDDSLARLWEFLKRIKLYENSLIVIFSDHGEGLGEHNWYFHGKNIYQEQMQVPMIMRFPQKKHAGRRVNGFVTLMDIAPTVLEYADAENFPNARGKSLLGCIKGGEPAFRRDKVYFERRWYPPQPGKNRLNWERGEKFGVRGERWKYIWRSEGSCELYDLVRDPHELQNLIVANPDIAESLRRDLESFWKIVGKGKIVPPSLEPASRKRLEALGYTR